jgi:hypothetical protein
MASAEGHAARRSRRWAWRRSSSQEVFRTIARLKCRGRRRMLLVEQFARSPRSRWPMMYVMERGRIVVEGTPAQLRADERVLAAYLGWSAAHLGVPPARTAAARRSAARSALGRCRPAASPTASSKRWRGAPAPRPPAPRTPCRPRS